MFLRRLNLRGTLSAGKMSVNLTHVAGLKGIPPPPKYREMEFLERMKLRMLEKVLQCPSTMRPFKMQKRLWHMRGPEELHTNLLHKHFGIIRQGQRMDGGKGGIDHYATPIKVNRVIIEVMGKCEYFEVKRVLEEIASNLLFKALVITQTILENMKFI